MKSAAAIAIAPTPERRPTWRIAVDIANAFDPETGEVDLMRVEELQVELADKAEAIHHVQTEFEAQAEACKAEAKRLTARAKMLDARSERLGVYLLACMQQAGTRKLQTPLVTASIHAGKERAEVDDISKLPLEFIREKTTTEADKVGLLAKLKTGATVEGARLVVGEETVRFR